MAQICEEEKMKGNLTFSNACTYYQIPGITESFKTRVRNFIFENIREVVPTQTYVDMTVKNPQLIAELFEFALNQK